MEFLISLKNSQLSKEKNIKVKEKEVPIRIFDILQI